MSQTRTFDAGQGSRERSKKSCCPRCGSDDLKYDMKQPAKGLVRCLNCALLFSKTRRIVSLKNRW